MVWEVKPRSDLLAGHVPSITERGGWADFHTDSQYRERPENCVLLSVVRQASSGGETLLLHADVLLDLLGSSEKGRRALNVLREPRFPFAVPMSFRAEPGSPEHVEKAIFSESPVVRYRRDTLDEGFKKVPDLATKDALRALAVLRGVIRSALPGTTREALCAGDIILIDNHRVLHGRTAFSDSRRTLLRIRVNTVQRLKALVDES